MVLRLLLLAIPAILLVHWFAGDHTTLLFLCSMVAMIPCHSCLAGLIALCRVAQRYPGRHGDAGSTRLRSQSDLHGHHSHGHDWQRLGNGHGYQSSAQGSDGSGVQRLIA